MCVYVYVYMPMIAYACVYTYECMRLYIHTSMHTQIHRHRHAYRQTHTETETDRQIDVHLLHFFCNDFLNNDLFFNGFHNRLFDDSIHVHDLVFRHNFFDVNGYLCKCVRRCE